MIGAAPHWADTDWFRHSKWAEENRAVFFARLKRARRKASYITIQADYLVHADDEREWLGAAEILEPIRDPAISESEVAMVEMLLGQAYEELDRLDDAVIAYRESMAAMRRIPSMVCNSHYFFARCVAERGLRDLHDEARAALDCNPALLDGRHVSRGNHFSDLAARACMAAAEGDPKTSGIAAHALEALGLSAEHPLDMHQLSRRSLRTIRLVVSMLPTGHGLARAVQAI